MKKIRPTTRQYASSFVYDDVKISGFKWSSLTRRLPAISLQVKEPAEQPKAEIPKTSAHKKETRLYPLWNIVLSRLSTKILFALYKCKYLVSISYEAIVLVVRPTAILRTASIIPAAS